jgi:uncharacterized protein (TIGR02646 family)
MIRLRRKGLRTPSDWEAIVDAAFPDAKAFRKAAAAFEKLAEHGAKRQKGFIAYAGHVLPVDGDERHYFPAVWSDHAPTRQAIAAMSRGFCAYCQSPVSCSHAGMGGAEKPPGQIEHFKPKSRFPAHAYAWGNYFLSCAGCNVAKKDKWPRGGYVRPDRGKPENRFTVSRNGEVEARRRKDEPARATIRDLNLQRDWLIRQREGAIRSHLNVVEKVIGRRGIHLRDLLVADFVAFSAAINQNVQRAWEDGMRKRPRQGGSPRSGGSAPPRHRGHQERAPRGSENT